MKQKEGFTLWFTGLPSSGKSTLADALAPKLREMGWPVERLDGDIVRQGLCRDLGFSKEDRDFNIERVTFVAKLLSRNGVATLVSFISPYRRMRDYAREEIKNFYEVYVKCPVDVCKERDVKGMYKKAAAGEISGFTGVDDPYEEPEGAEIVIDTSGQNIEDCVAEIIRGVQYVDKESYEKYYSCNL